jgi:hypothetical protein
MHPHDDETIAGDALRGAKAIAAFRGEALRRTNYLLERGLIPAGKEGNLWVASRRVLRAHHARLTGADAA